MYLIDKDCIIFDIKDNTKEEVIQTLVCKLEKVGNIDNASQFYQDVLKREKISATVIGDEMGLPHGRSQCVKRPCLCFGRLHKPVIWDEKTHEEVRYVILIAAMKQSANDIYMKMISSLARKLMHDEYRMILTNGTKEDVYRFLNETMQS